MTHLDRLHKLGLVLPEPAPTHEFVPASIAGDLVFVSGHAPFADDEFRFRGKVGKELDLAGARQAAELAALGCLRSLQESIGTLGRVRRVLKLTGYVNCTADFCDLPQVTDAASVLLISLFHPHGKHARTTVGVNSLPLGVAVELELMVQIGSSPAERIDTGQDRLRLLEQFGEAWDAGDVDKLMSMITDDCVYAASVGPEPGATYAGKQAVREGFLAMLALDSGGVSRTGRVFVAGNLGVSEWSYLFRAGSDAEFEVRGCDIFEFRGGRISRKDAFRKSSFVDSRSL